MSKRYYSENFIQQHLPDGYSSTINPLTGTMTIKGPNGKQVEEFGNISGTYFPDVKDVTYHTSDGMTHYVYDVGKVDRRLIPIFNAAGGGATFNMLSGKYVYGGHDLGSNPTHAAGYVSVYDYCKANGLATTNIKLEPDGQTTVSYTNYDGKPVSTTIDTRNGAWTDVQLNSTYLYNLPKADDLESIYGTGASSGSSGGSGSSAQADYEQAQKEGATASNKILDNILNGSNPNVNAATSAKQNFTISKEDYAALRAKYPNYSDEQLTNIIANSDWAKNFGAGLSNGLSTGDLKGATLEEFIASANAGNASAKEVTDATIAQQRNNLLKEIANDPEAYKAAVQQLRTDVANGTVTGQAAANMLNALRDSNNAYKSSADELYASVGGTGADSAAGSIRSTIYNNLVSAYGGHTNQQLNTLSNDMLMQSADVNGNLKTALSLINQGVLSEAANAERAAADEEARIIREARDRNSKAAQASTGSIASANAAADALTNYAATASDLTGNTANGLNSTAAANAANAYDYTNYGGGTYNKPKYTNAPYIDETLYNTLLTDDYLKFLSDDTFKQYTTLASEADLAERYGLSDLMDINNVVDRFTGYQQQANTESDRVFNDAQRAYLMAVAAGDSKTAEQLTRLALTASTSRKNLYGATALANQFAQQKANAAVSNNLYYDTIRQQALNKSSMANAENTGRQQWQSLVGDGNPNSANGGFRAAYNTHVGNVNAANTYYGDLIRGGMNNQSNYNTVVSGLNNTSNDTLSQYAANLNGINAQGAATNTTNSAAVAGIKNNAGVQKLINNAILNK